jgi:hypothetical protein
MMDRRPPAGLYFLRHSAPQHVPVIFAARCLLPNAYNEFSLAAPQQMRAVLQACDVTCGIGDPL